MKRLKLWPPKSPYKVALMISGKHVRMRIFDRAKEHLTVVSATTTEEDIRQKLLARRRANGKPGKRLPKYTSNEDTAMFVAKELARRAKAKGISWVEQAHRIRGTGIWKKVTVVWNQNGLHNVQQMRDPMVSKRTPPAEFFHNRLDLKVRRWQEGPKLNVKLGLQVAAADVPSPSKASSAGQASDAPTTSGTLAGQAADAPSTSEASSPDQASDAPTTSGTLAGQAADAPSTSEVLPADQASNAPTTSETSSAGQAADAQSTSEASPADQASDAPTTSATSSAGEVADAPSTAEASSAGEAADAPSTAEASSAGETADSPTTSEASSAGETADSPTTLEASLAGQASDAPTTSAASSAGETADSPTTSEASSADQGPSGESSAARGKAAKKKKK